MSASAIRQIHADLEPVLMRFRRKARELTRLNPAAGERMQALLPRLAKASDRAEELVRQLEQGDLSRTEAEDTLHALYQAVGRLRGEMREIDRRDMSGVGRRLKAVRNQIQRGHRALKTLTFDREPETTTPGV